MQRTLLLALHRIAFSTHLILLEKRNLPICEEQHRILLKLELANSSQSRALFSRWLYHRFSSDAPSLSRCNVSLGHFQELFPENIHIPIRNA